jgi:NAD(P)-dependent dehydrogenase (short-subunit alcohol dehydrogenase family)
VSRGDGWQALGSVAAAAAFGVGAGLGAAKGGPPTRTVLVTGGSRGFGLLIAHEYLRRGARVAICARDAAGLERAKAQLERRGRAVLALPCDVRDEKAVAELVAAAEQHLGPLDTVVHNAGVIQVGPAEHMTLADFEDALRVHLFGGLHLVKAALPSLLRARRGRIMNVASIAGLMPVPHLLPYGASKAALTAWSEGLRAELAGSRVTVTTVCPALMRTGSPRNARFKGRHREEHAWFSVGDSLPLLTIGAERAARRAVRAAELGRARIVFPRFALLAVAAHALAPGLTLGVLGGVDRLLPRAGGIGARSRSGAESASAWSPSALTVLTERAAARNNELPGP